MHFIRFIYVIYLYAFYMPLVRILYAVRFSYAFRMLAFYAYKMHTKCVVDHFYAFATLFICISYAFHTTCVVFAYEKRIKRVEKVKSQKEIQQKAYKKHYKSV